MKTLWKYILAFIVAIVAFFVLWKLRKQEAELLVLRARVANEEASLRDAEDKLKVTKNNEEIEKLKKEIEEKKKLVERQKLELRVYAEEIEKRINAVQQAKTWEDLKNV